MPIEHSPLGVCPLCGEEVPERDVLIEYESGLFAECPGCEQPVHPEAS